PRSTASTQVGEKRVLEGCVPDPRVPVLRRALAKAPSRRFANSRAVASALALCRDQTRPSPAIMRDTAARGDDRTAAVWTGPSSISGLIDRIIERSPPPDSGAQAAARTADTGPAAAPLGPAAHTTAPPAGAAGAPPPAAPPPRRRRRARGPRPPDGGGRGGAPETGPLPPRVEGVAHPRRGAAPQGAAGRRPFGAVARGPRPGRARHAG